MASHLHDYNPTARSAFLTSIGLVMTITLCCFYFVFRSQAAGEPEPGSQISNGERQVANVPYFIESEEFHSTLILNNNQTEEKLATVTFFNSEGKRWEHAPIRLKPRLVQRFLLSDLLKKAPSDFRSGNIQIVHHGLPFDVMEQITVASDDQRLSFESIRTAASDFVMSRLDGIYWVPDSETEAKVALTNVGTIKLGVTIIAGQNEEKVSLRPRETRVFDLREFVRDAKGKDSATLVTLEHDGAPGALIATGFALNRRTGFSSNLTFADCGTAKSMSLAGAHIRLGPADPSEGFPSSTVFRAPLLIANTMDELVSARISIEYTMGGQPASVQLSPISLASRQVKKVELGEELERRGITGLLDDAGIDISYDGMPGTVIGRLTSYDTSKEFAFDVPIKDPQGGPSNGGYPWRLDDGYTTVLHLKNTLDKEVKAIYRLIYEDGEYNPEPIKLAPHQTIAIDIRKLRDAQTKDLRGAIMPKDIETGKILWMGLDPQFVIIGRAEVAKISTGIASSFSCNVCECGQVYVRDVGYTPYLSPGSLTMPVDATSSFSVNEYLKTNCSYDYWGPVGPSSTPSWNSSDPSVATVSGQTITAVGPGTTTISASWCCDLVAYGYNCTPQYSGGGATATLNVNLSVSKIQYQSDSGYVDISDTLYILKGSTINFNAVPNPTNGVWPTGQPIWAGTSGASGSGQTTSVTFNTASSSTTDYKTVTATSGNTVTANIIVYDLSGVLTPEDQFNGRSTSRFGVKENVDLSYTVTPSITPSQMGGIGWVLTSGDGTLSGSSNGAGTYNAPGFATNPVLKLAINSGPSQNQGPTYNITIVEPSGAYAIQKPGAGLRHTYGMLGVATFTNVYLIPTDVSFMNVAFSEGTATAAAHGFWAGLNGVTHPANGPISITDCNVVDGCYAFEDSIDTQDWSGPFSNGDFSWNIPWRYVFGAPVQVYATFTFATHYQTADATGKATIQKAGAGPFARELNDPTSVASP